MEEKTENRVQALERRVVELGSEVADLKSIIYRLCQAHQEWCPHKWAETGRYTQTKYNYYEGGRIEEAESNEVVGYVCLMCGKKAKRIGEKWEEEKVQG